VSPADSFGTPIGVGIEPTNPISAKLLADRLATLSELREQDHKSSEQSRRHAEDDSAPPNPYDPRDYPSRHHQPRHRTATHPRLRTT
jgi:hypothetical protein